MKVRIYSVKKRSQKEVQEIIDAFLDNQSLIEISKKYDISDDSIYRIMQKHFGTYKDRSPIRREKVNQLEKKLKEKDKEIALLRAALKKF